MVSEREAAQILADTGAIRRSGGDVGTSVTLDICRLSSHPAQSASIVAGLAERLRPFAADGNTLVSPNTASLPLAALVATALRLPLAYLRPKPKGHGKQRQVEGVLPEGGRALLLFDAIHGGDAVHEAIGIVERHGATVGVVAAALVFDPASVATVSLEAGVPLVTLTDAAQTGVVLSHASPDASVGGRAAAAAWETRAIPTDADRQALKVRVARALLGIGAVTINAAQPYRYTSGILSPIYTDNRLLISHPDAWDVIVEGFGSAVAAIAREHGLDALAGAATAGLPHAARIGQRLGMPMLYVDLSLPGDDGAQGRLYGDLTPGDRLVIVEDLVTTGKSVIEFADALTARQATVGWCVAIFTYDVAGAQATFAARGLSFAALCDIDTLLDVAVQDGSISAEDRAAVHEWLADRTAWSDRAEARLAAANPA